VFNLLPGQGLGFHANKLLAWGLGYWEALVVEVFKRSKSRFEESAFAIQIREEDEEILMILKAFLFMKEN